MPGSHSLTHLLKAISAVALLSASACLYADSFTQINLTSDVPNLANNTDPNLKNPWGLAFSPTSPFWTSNQASGTATLYDGAGTPQALVVAIPPGAAPPTGPTGQVFNTGGAGFLLSNGNPSTFIFDTLNGTLAAWNGSSGTTAQQVISTPGAIYTGLAQNTTGGNTYLYAADSTGKVRVFDSTWDEVTPTLFNNKFVDTTLPVGFTPFNIQKVGTSLYVTYAQLTPMGTPLPGGYVDEYDAAGNFIRRVASSGSLSAPWGVTLAPANFGSFSNDLLIGNFGNGEILAYDPLTGTFLGTLDDANGDPLVNPFLWALATRTGGNNVNLDAVYFTAGINDEQDGLFGAIVSDTPSAVPEPASIFGTAFGLIAFAAARIRRSL